MIKVIVSYREKDIKSVEIKGHAGFAKHGRDIVCSAVSAIVQTALLSVIEFSDSDVKYVVNEDSGYLYFDVPSPKSEEENIRIQAVLEAMLIGVRDVEKGYSPYVKTEVRKICL